MTRINSNPNQLSLLHILLGTLFGDWIVRRVGTSQKAGGDGKVKNGRNAKKATGNIWI